MPSINNFKILALDDNPLFLCSLKRMLIAEPYTMITTTDPAQALLIMEEEQIDLVLLDLQMPCRDGFSVLEDMVSLYPDTAVIMLTGHGGVQQAVRSLKRGAADFLEKPCPPSVLSKILATYHTISQQRYSREKIRHPLFEFPDLVGETPEMQRLKALIARVAVSEAPVLILGESGTGKELVAQAVHHHSPRKNGPFCVVDCAAINESVLESELFGHEQGAFTGADLPTLGLIRSADQGTLFLDEIGELPLKIQAKLLRTLQEHEVRPVGCTQYQPVDIRIIAATNKNLEHETTKGLFRSDLYFRISAIPLLLPPLRERVGDIPLLASHLLKYLTKDTCKSISHEALQLLQAYSWPGNVRELDNVLRRALALFEDNIIQPDDLPAALVVESTTGNKNLPVEDSLLAYEQSAMGNALQKTNNNKRKAAALLGISEATLYRKLKLFGLSK